MYKTLFVSDDPYLQSTIGLNCISFAQYMEQYPKLKEPKIRVINLCDTSRYLSHGYYCSLLAEARKHQVLPRVKVILALGNNNNQNIALSTIQKRSEHLFTEEKVEFVMCMGQHIEPQHKKLANWIYQNFPAPLLLVSLHKQQNETTFNVQRCSLNQLNEQQRQFCLDTLQSFSHKAWRTSSNKKKYRWDMAILTNQNEKVPPSNKGAISRFIRAAKQLGIYATEVEAGAITSLSQYDALFIRETTAIDHHTYRLAHEAEKLGLVVMDDPDSILRCCNKVYLHDAFSYQDVPSLKTHILANNSAETIEFLERELGYPLVLKIPESAFSKGVFKIKDRGEFIDVTTKLLADSALYIAQEYLFTDFDWRIGVLNGSAIYACRYYMAKNHWQIYNHKSKRNFSGGFDAISIFEVPQYVLQAALKAANTVGKGLYGIDVKEVNGQAYVLEVNDNPSIEFGVEDHYLGNELYMLIMAEFLRRLESRGLN